eukprot:g7273.t1
MAAFFLPRDRDHTTFTADSEDAASVEPPLPPYAQWPLCEVCYFARGECAKAKGFKHVQRAQEVCRDWKKKGLCQRGEKCRFFHNGRWPLDKDRHGELLKFCLNEVGPASAASLGRTEIVDEHHTASRLYPVGDYDKTLGEPAADATLAEYLRGVLDLATQAPDLFTVDTQFFDKVKEVARSRFPGVDADAAERFRTFLKSEYIQTAADFSAEVEDERLLKLFPSFGEGAKTAATAEYNLQPVLPLGKKTEPLPYLVHLWKSVRGLSRGPAVRRFNEHAPEEREEEVRTALAFKKKQTEALNFVRDQLPSQGQQDIKFDDSDLSALPYTLEARSGEPKVYLGTEIVRTVRGLRAGTQEGNKFQQDVEWRSKILAELKENFVDEEKWAALFSLVEEVTGQTRKNVEERWKLQRDAISVTRAAGTPNRKAPNRKRPETDYAETLAPERNAAGQFPTICMMTTAGDVAKFKRDYMDSVMKLAADFPRKFNADKTFASKVRTFLAREFPQTDVAALARLRGFAVKKLQEADATRTRERADALLEGRAEPAQRYSFDLEAPENCTPESTLAWVSSALTTYLRRCLAVAQAPHFARLFNGQEHETRTAVIEAELENLPTVDKVSAWITFLETQGGVGASAGESHNIGTRPATYADFFRPCAVRCFSALNNSIVKERLSTRAEFLQQLARAPLPPHSKTFMEESAAARESRARKVLGDVYTCRKCAGACANYAKPEDEPLCWQCFGREADEKVTEVRANFLAFLNERLENTGFLHPKQVLRWGLTFYEYCLESCAKAHKRRREPGPDDNYELTRANLKKRVLDPMEKDRETMQATLQTQLRECFDAMGGYMKKLIYTRLQTHHKRQCRKIEQVFGRVILPALEGIAADKQALRDEYGGSADQVPAELANRDAANKWERADFRFDNSMSDATTVCLYYVASVCITFASGDMLADMLAKLVARGDVQRFADHGDDEQYVIYRRRSGGDEAGNDVSNTFIALHEDADGAGARGGAHLFVDATLERGRRMYGLDPETADRKAVQHWQREAVWALFSKLNRDTFAKRVDYDAGADPELNLPAGEKIYPTWLVTPGFRGPQDANHQENKKYAENDDVVRTKRRPFFDGHEQEPYSWAKKLGEIAVTERPAFRELLGYEKMRTHQNSNLSREVFVEGLGFVEEDMKSLEDAVVREIKATRTADDPEYDAASFGGACAAWE